MDAPAIQMYPVEDSFAERQLISLRVAETGVTAMSRIIVFFGGFSVGIGLGVLVSYPLGITAPGWWALCGLIGGLWRLKVMRAARRRRERGLLLPPE